MAVETFVVNSAGKASITKDPDATLDYTFDWTDWLAAASTPADTINAATFTLAGDGAVGASIGSSSFNTTKATAWVQGGTAGATIELRCHITTTGGRQDDRTVYLKVKER